MKFLQVASLFVVFSLFSCDQIDAVGEKISELRDARQKGQTDAASPTGAAATVQDLAQTDFQAFISEPGRLNIVDFHADWCAPCRKLSPVLTDLVEKNAGVARLGKIDVDQAKQLARLEKVRNIPDVRFYLEGKLVHRFVGVESRETLENLIAKHTEQLATKEVSLKQSKPKLKKVVGKKSTEKSSEEAKREAKPMDEAMIPMKKDWMPPGMSRQK